MKLTRLGIFVFYDSRGHANDYVKYFLADIMQNFERLVIISNGMVDYETCKYFQSVTPDFFVRENKGLDAAAYRIGLLAYVGWDELEKYDEIILMNDTCYGPVYSSKEIFDTMDNRDLDFWGITAGYKSVDGWNTLPQGYIPDHIQTFFMAFRKKMIKSNVFREYWTNYNSEWNTFCEVVTKHELILTEYFANQGFTWDVYVDIGDHCSTNINKNCNLNGYAAYSMLHDFHSPFIKRKTFVLDRGERLHMGGGEDLNRAMKFLLDKNLYDSNLIYADLIKRFNTWDLYNSLNMNYIITETEGVLKGEKNNECLIAIYCDSLVGVKKSIPYLKCLYHIFDVVVLLSENADIDKIRKIIEAEHIVLRDLVLCPAAVNGIPTLWLIGERIKEYKFVCFTHDASYYWGEDADIIYDSIFYALQENTIKNSKYVEKCLYFLKEKPEIGLLVAPYMLHNKYYHSLHNFWENDFENIEKLASILRLDCQLDPLKPGISRGGAFICRTEILKPVLDWKIAKQDYLENNIFSIFTPQQWEKIMPFLAQSEGYLTGVMMNENFASNYITTLKYYLQDLLRKVQPLENNFELSYNAFSHLIADKITTRMVQYPEKKLEDLNCEIKNLYAILEEKEQVIQTLFPLTSLKLQMRLRLKKYLPGTIYKLCVCLKRFVLGPHNIKFNYND